jgi:CelD/BcsL family acetyltransferase involved in cellulose biosynthesis
MNAEVRVHRRWSDLPADVTGFLASATENAFLRPSWLEAWHAFYLAPGWSPHVVVVTGPTGILAVVPLVERSVGPLRLFRFAGHGLGNYLDMVVRPEAAAVATRTLLAHLESIAPAVLEWRDLPQDSPSRPALVDSRAGATRLYPCPRVRFGATWTTHFASVVPNKKHRRSIERSVGRLAELGRLEFEANVQSPEPGFIEELRSLHARRFVGTPNPLLSERFWTFLQHLVPLALGADLRVSTLRIEGRLISSVIGVRSGRTFVSYAPAFDPALASLMPGHAHLFLLQEALLNDGWEAFDFSKGEDFYKRRWSNDESWNWEYTFGFGVLGRAVAKVLFARTWLRAWARANGITARVRRIASRGRRSHAPTAASG